ncbi:MAG TPA: helix-turn-helix domain-containing protein [Candidatus Caldiarchaeum subterraneum]|uniref:Helix-turn-helix domain-containing protein n=1 Tax=Caldiarchaeum subterraneum TaxID=311458 RepID=A0A832ZUH8_CALS0|nr:helix-turn-helix domain-containing protein [Candidatus Caldarchaeum subterraneum]
MLLPSEIESKLTIPMIRAIVAKRLISEHDYTQEEVAKALGVTQAAVSNYIRGVRGVMINLEANPEIDTRIDEIVDLILKNAPQAEVAKKFNSLLEDIRRKRILCDVHKRIEPDVDVDSCHVCGE